MYPTYRLCQVSMWILNSPIINFHSFSPLHSPPYGPETLGQESVLYVKQEKN